MKRFTFALSAFVALSAALATNIDSRTSVCGSKGYDRIEGDDYASPVKYAACVAKCQQSEKCLSISYGNKECNLYNVAVTGNFEPVSDSPYAFYDASCFSESSTTSTTTTSTSSSTSKTSTKGSSTTAKATSTNLPSTTSVKISSTTTTTTMTTTTTKGSSAASSKSSSTTSTNTAAVSTPPCPLPTFSVTNFLWFNSSHNALCADNRPDVGDGTGCLDGNGNWCDPSLDKNCTHCGIGVCYTGLPTQPVGYGPADYVQADVSNIGSCGQSDPGTTPRRAVGDGEAVRCGGSQYQMGFLGDSNIAKSVAYFNFQNQYFCPNVKAYYTAYGSGNTSMSCTYDSGRNATCKLDKPSFDIVATRFDNVGSYN